MSTHTIVVHVEHAANRVLGNLQPAVEVAPKRCFEVEIDEQSQVTSFRCCA